MSSLKKPRKLIAACINSKSAGMTKNAITASFVSLYLTASGMKKVESKKLFEAVIFVEGEMAVENVDGLSILRVPLEVVDGVIERKFNSKNFHAYEHPGHELCIFAIGSQVFCQDIVRCALIDKEPKIPEWGQEFMTVLGAARQCEVVWNDSGNGDALRNGDIIAMLAEAKRVGAIPDQLGL